ncbi:T9SS type A sorting domain-containing protein [Sporocytophaga myxococcoides]|uniref:T9SS type A sorting domain-containing protein n=1 Tax=Sporocytophaga myxococcoides TaxID=153721 RepID=UPI000427D288|nr:T9SS type A sorting domain-containing protein [Sporocytophaga myxococcoides]
MKKNILTTAILLASIAGTASAQGVADNFILPKHSSLSAGDNFGASISKFDNYILVGAPDDDKNPATDCQGRFQMTGGAVLYKDGQVIRKYEGTSVFVHNFEIGSKLGQSVAVAAEWLAIGASNDSTTGAVLLVKKDNTGEFSSSVFKKLKMPTNANITPGAANNFGGAVALGRNTLVVGAKRANVNGIDCGAVFIYKLVNGNWNHVSTLVAPNNGLESGFGASVAISNDETKIIVGAPNDFPTSQGTNGSVNIYHNTGGNNWTLNSGIAGGFGIQDGRYGTTVDISNDRAIIGTVGNVVHLIKLVSGGWQDDQVIQSSGDILDVAIEGTKAVYGQFVDGGRVVQLERAGTSASPWVRRSAAGLTQAGARMGWSVDLSNNVVAAGAFGYDWPDLVDPCFTSSNDEAGGAVAYGFDQFNGQYFQGHNFFRSADEVETGNLNAVKTVTVSPNPAESGFIEINSGANVKEIFAVNGMGVNNKLTLQDNNMADISTLAPGIYILQIFTEDGSYTDKLVVK